MRARAAAFFVAVLATGCSFDLSLPEAPQVGSLKGTLDTGGKIVAGNREILLVDEEGSQKTQKTAADGAFAFTDLRPGNYFIELKLPGFAPYIRPNIRVKSGQELDVGTLSPAWLQGTSSEGVLSGKVVVRNGAGSATGGTVEFSLVGEDTPLALATVGAGGQFVQRLPPGTYNLKAQHEQYITATRDSVVVSEGATTDISATPLELGVDPATLTGTVMKEVDGSAPIAASGVTVTVLVAGNTTTTTTDSLGKFTLTGLGSGTAELTFALTGFHSETSTRTVTLARGQTTTLSSNALMLLDRGHISGRVELQDPNGSVAEVTVGVFGTSYGAIVLPDAADKSKGSFRISSIPIGSYTVTAARERYSTATKSNVNVTRDQTFDAGTMTLLLLAGDFEVDDGDSNSAPGYVNKRAVTLKLNNVTNAAMYRVDVDSTFTNSPTFTNLTGTQVAWTVPSSVAEGPFTVYLQYQDSLGTVSPALSSNVILDTAAPSSPDVKINGGAAYSNTPSNLILTLSASETTSQLKDVILGEALGADGGVVGVRQAYQLNVPFVRTATTDGVQTVHAQFVDLAGNVSVPATASITIDTLAPSGSISIQQGVAASAAGFTNDDEVVINETYTSETGLQLRLANSSAALQFAQLQPVQPAAGWRLDPVGEGTKTVYAQLQDLAGNKSNILTATIVYDVSPPNPAALTLISPQITSGTTATLGLNAADNGSGLAATAGVTVSETLLFSGGNTVGPIAYPASAQLSFPLSSGDGQKTLYARYLDTAGNSAIAQVSLTLDTEAPAGSFFIEGALADGAASSDLTATSSVTLRLTQSGATRYAVGDGTFTCPSAASAYSTLTSNNISHTLTGTGASRTVRLCLMDGAGNIAGPLEDAISLDTAAPAGCALALEVPRGQSYVSTGFTNTPNIRARISGCGDVPATLALTTTGQACTDPALSWTAFSALSSVTLTSAPGTKSVGACVRDAARNTSTLAAVSIVLETTPPTLTVSVQGSSPTTSPNITLTLSATDSSSFGASDALTASEDPTFAAGGNTVGPQGMVSSLPFVLSSGNGQKRIYVRAVDLAGNETVKTADVELDTTPPSGTVTVYGTLADGTESTAWATSTAVSVAFSSPDVAAYSFVPSSTSACTGASYTNVTSARAAATLVGTGSLRSVFVCIRDGAGNVAGPLTDSIAFDNAAPASCALTLEALRGGVFTSNGFTNATSIRGRVSGCSEATPEMSISVDALPTCTSAALAWQPFVAPADLSLPATETSHSVYVCVRDAQKNAVLVGPTTITLDTTAPAITAAALQLATVNTATVTVNVTATDANGLAHPDALTSSEDAFFQGQYTVGPNPYAASHVFSLSPVEGSRSIFLRVRDRAGNETSRTLTATRDTVAPTGTFTITGALADGTPSSTLTATPNVTLNVTSSGASHYAVGDDTMTACPAAADASWQTLSGSSLSRTLSGSGTTRTVTLCLKDAAGNVGALLTQTIALDAAAPQGCTLAMEAERLTDIWVNNGFSRSLSVRGSVTTCNEQPVEMVIAVDSTPNCSAAGLAWETFKAPAAVTLPATEVSHAVRFCVRDAAHNTALVGPVSIVLDRTAPDVSAISLSGGGSTRNATENVLLTATDANGLTHADALTISETSDYTGATTVGPQTSASSTPFAFSAGDGDKTIYVRLRDRAGNETTRVLTTAVDTVAPTVTVEVTGALANGTPSTTLTATASVTVSLSSSDATRYAVGDELLDTCPTALASYTALAGTHQFTTTLSGSTAPRTVAVCVRDAAGNVAGPFTDTIAFDNTAPTGCSLSLKALRDGAYVDNGHAASVDIRAAVTGCAETPSEIAVAEGSVTDCNAAALSWRPLLETDVTLTATQGDHNVGACVRDAAKNAAALGGKTIKLDTIKPSGLTAAVAQGAFASAVGITLNLAASDANNFSSVDGLTISENLSFTGATPRTFAASVPYTLSSTDGRKTLYVRVRDPAGNESITSVEVTLDTQAPLSSDFTLSIVGQRADGSLSTAVTAVTTGLTVDITAASGAASAYAVVTGSTTCAAASYSPLTGSSVTANLDTSLTPANIRFCFRDDAGNKLAAPVSDPDGIVVDNTPPSGCALTLVGFRRDGSDAGTSITATSGVVAFLSGCSADTAQFFTAAGTTGCSPTMSAAWSTYAPNVSSTVGLAGSDGPNNVSGCVRDSAFNVAAIPTQTIVLDTSGPNAFNLVINNGEDFVNKAYADVFGLTVDVRGNANNAVSWSISDDQNSFPAPSTFTNPSTNMPFTLSGPGVQRVYAQFWDEVGNPSAVVSDQIIVDTSPPSMTGASVTILSKSLFGDAGYANSVSATLGQTRPTDGDVVAVRFAEDSTTATACSAGDFVNSSWEALTNNYSFIWSSGEGERKVCAQWMDEAGNASTAFRSDSVTVDLTPPSAPIILTADRVFNPSGPGARDVVVDVALDSVDQSQHQRFQILGGELAPAWKDANPPPVGNKIPFQFKVNVSDGGTAFPDGRMVNILRVRDIDRAGNQGAESSVVFTTDIKGPPGVTLNTFWTDNGNGRGTVHWLAADAGDLAGYLVYYGSAPSTDGGLAGFTGSFADQGLSPIRIPANPTASSGYLTLSGLPNGSSTYVTVRAVDQANNVGEAPVQLPLEVAVQPNPVSPNMLIDITPFMNHDGGIQGSLISNPNYTSVDRMVVNGSYAYALGVVGNTGVCAPVYMTSYPYRVALQAFALDPITSQLQSGVPQVGAQVVAQGATQIWKETVCLTTSDTDLVVEPPYLYMATGSKLRIFDLKNPMLPSLISEMDFAGAFADAGIANSSSVTSLAVKGRDMFLSGYSSSPVARSIYHLDLSTLYDLDAGSRPSFLSVTGVANPAKQPPAIVWTKNRLIATGDPQNGASYYDLAPVLDSNPLTVWSNSALLVPDAGSEFVYGSSRGAPIVSGNYLFSSYTGFMYPEQLNVCDMKAQWSSGLTYPTAVASAPFAGMGQQLMAGSQMFLNDIQSTGVRTIDAMDLTDVQDNGMFTPAFVVGGAYYPNASQALFGNYMLLGSTRSALRVLELATPRGLHLSAATSTAGWWHDVAPGFVVSSGGATYDLTKNLAPLNAPGVVQRESYGAARFDNILVETTWNRTWRFTNLERVLDRDPTTPWSTSNPADVAPSVQFPFGIRPGGIARYGNFLVVAEMRNSPTTSVWIEIFDATRLREGRGMVTLPTTSAIESFKVADWAQTYWEDASVNITLNAGRAALTVTNNWGENQTTSNAGSAYFLDLRKYFDDDSADPLPTEVLQAQFDVPQAKEAVIAGNRAYLVTGNRFTPAFTVIPGGFYAFDAANVMDDDPATTGVTQLSFTGLYGADSLAVSGGHAYVTPYSTAAPGVTVIDITSPTQPKNVALYPFRQDVYGRTDYIHKVLRTHTSVVGTRLYVSAMDRLEIIELE